MKLISGKHPRTATICRTDYTMVDFRVGVESATTEEEVYSSSAIMAIVE